MSTLSYIILFTLLGSIGALLGGVILLLIGKLAAKISHFMAAFAAGILLGTAFIDLLPEALNHSEELGQEINIFLWVLFGILVFFLLERFIHWFHHHHGANELKREEKKAVIPLIIFGDTFHNFIDGMLIAATFMVDIKLGMVTTLAVAAHEIPQEIGDFGLLLHLGMSKIKVLTVNLISAAAALIGALLAYSFGDVIEGIIPILLSLACGFFIYIALSDLIPEIHSEERKDVAFWESVLLLLGVIIIYILVSILEQGG